MLYKNIEYWILTEIDGTKNDGDTIDKKIKERKKEMNLIDSYCLF